MTYKQPAYPVILTDGDWQKNKGKVASAAGKTGIGALMDKAEAAYAGVAWKELDIRNNISGHVKDWKDSDVDKAFDKCKVQFPKLGALEKALVALEKKAGEVATSWKKSKLIPSSSAKHAQAVSDAAKKLSYEAAQGTISDAVAADKKLMLKDMADNAAVYTKLLNQLRKNVDDFPAESKKATVEDYGHFWGQYIRAPGTALPVLVQQYPQLDAEWKIWKQFSNKQTTPADAKELEKQLLVLNKLAQNLKPKLANL